MSWKMYILLLNILLIIGVLVKIKLIFLAEFTIMSIYMCEQNHHWHYISIMSMDLSACVKILGYTDNCRTRKGAWAWASGFSPPFRNPATLATSNELIPNATFKKIEGSMETFQFEIFWSLSVRTPSIRLPHLQKSSNVVPWFPLPPPFCKNIALIIINFGESVIET